MVKKKDSTAVKEVEEEPKKEPEIQKEPSPESEQKPNTSPAPQPNEASDVPIYRKPVPLMIAGIIIVVVIGIILLSGGSDTSDDLSDNEMSEEPNSWEDVETIEGSIAMGGPSTTIPDERVTFEVEETVYQMDMILTWNPQSMDLDLEIENPDGDVVAQSGNSPGTPETVRIKNIKPGTWAALIDPFAAVNVQYTLEITYFHETGNVSGESLYKMEKTYEAETSDASEDFDVGAETESININFMATSTEGSMTIEVQDPEGNVVFSGGASGGGDTNEDQTTEGKEGTWKVVYTFEGFSGDVEVQIAGE
jgi:hypothetical protein